MCHQRRHQLPGTANYHTHTHKCFTIIVTVITTSRMCAVICLTVKLILLQVLKNRRLCDTKLQQRRLVLSQGRKKKSQLEPPTSRARGQAKTSSSNSNNKKRVPAEPVDRLATLREKANETQQKTEQKNNRCHGPSEGKGFSRGGEFFETMKRG